MATNNLPNRSTLKDVEHIRAGLTIVIDDLHGKGRGDLTAPFARCLVELASVDYAALAAIDANADAAGTE